MCIHNYDNICEVLTISCRGELTAHRIYVMIFSKWIRCYAHRVMSYISVCMHLHFRQKDTTRVKGLYMCNGFEMVIAKCYYVLIMNTTSPLINYDMVICTLKTETQFQSGCGKKRLHTSNTVCYNIPTMRKNDRTLHTMYNNIPTSLHLMNEPTISSTVYISFLNMNIWSDV